MTQTGLHHKKRMIRTAFRSGMAGAICLLTSGQLAFAGPIPMGQSATTALLSHTPDTAEIQAIELSQDLSSMLITGEFNTVRDAFNVIEVGKKKKKKKKNDTDDKDDDDDDDNDSGFEIDNLEAFENNDSLNLSGDLDDVYDALKEIGDDVAETGDIREPGDFARDQLNKYIRTALDDAFDGNRSHFAGGCITSGMNEYGTIWNTVWLAIDDLANKIGKKRILCISDSDSVYGRNYWKEHNVSLSKCQGNQKCTASAARLAYDDLLKSCYTRVYWETSKNSDREKKIRNLVGVNKYGFGNSSQDWTKNKNKLRDAAKRCNDTGIQYPNDGARFFRGVSSTDLQRWQRLKAYDEVGDRFDHKRLASYEDHFKKFISSGE